MRRTLVVWVAVVTALAGGAPAARSQTQPELVRFEWVTGILLHGDMASAAFQLDTTPFGGILIQRDGGALDVDPALSYGIRGSYRLSDRLQILASWLHSEARYRVQFPAEASDEGEFDLEALLLAGNDFLAGVGTTESAMSLARTDVYAASLRYEIPILNRWFFPFVAAGTGIYREKSDGNVFQLQYTREVPPNVQIAERAGASPLAGTGISAFAIDAKDILLTVGGGLRASLSPRWGVQVEVEDLIRMNPDLGYIDATSTPPPDVTVFRLYQTEFSAKSGPIHNLGVKIAMNYSLWPLDAPR